MSPAEQALNGKRLTLLLTASTAALFVGCATPTPSQPVASKGVTCPGYKAMPLPPGTPEGTTVRVRFQVTPDGRTQDVKVRKSSDIEHVDAAVVQFVSSLGCGPTGHSQPLVVELEYEFRGGPLPPPPPTRITSLPVETAPAPQAAIAPGTAAVGVCAATRLIPINLARPGSQPQYPSAELMARIEDPVRSTSSIGNSVLF